MLNRNSQIGYKIEASEGVEESLSDSDFLSNSADNDNKVSPNEVDRGLTRGTLTPQAMLKGGRLGEIHFAQELVGGGAAAAAPWHTGLRCSGFAAGVQLKKITVGSITNGPYKAGQVIGNNATLGSATAKGIFVRMINATTLVYEPTTGTFANGDVVYNYAVSQASSTQSGSPSNAGYAFRPLTENASTTPPTATVERRLGGERHTIVGARARGSLMLAVDNPAKLRTEFRGCPVFDGSNAGRPRTGSAAVITAVGTTPKPCKGMPLKLGSYAPPVITQLEIDLGNELTDRATMTDAELVGSGNLAPRIGNRRITAKIDPEYVVGASFGYIENLVNSGVTFEFNTEVGASSDANGVVQLYAPAAQIIGEHQPGDRGGITTVNPTLLLTGSQDDELVIWHVFG